MDVWSILINDTLGIIALIHFNISNEAGIFHWFNFYLAVDILRFEGWFFVVDRLALLFISF
jgi:hypothetical protein